MEDYFKHLQEAESQIINAISGLNTLKTLTSDAAILAFVTSTEALLNQQYVNIQATMTSFESSCSVTRPARLTQATTSSTIKGIETSTKPTEITSTLSLEKDSTASHSSLVTASGLTKVDTTLGTSPSLGIGN